LQEVYLFLLIMAAGYATRVFLEVLLKKFTIFEKLVVVLVRLVYYVLVPLSFFTVFLNRGVWVFDAYVLAYFLVFTTLAYVSISKTYKYADPSIILLSVFPNSVFLGFPVVYALLGRVNIAAVFGVVTVVLNTLIPEVIGRDAFSALRSLLTSTAFIGFLTGCLGHYVLGESAGSINQLLAWSSPLLSYTATYTMGLRIPTRLMGITRLKRESLITGLYRFIIAPILAYVLTAPLGFSKLDKYELVVVSMTPPAVMNIVIAEKYKWESQRAALIIAVLTVFYILAISPVLIVLTPKLR
jgi:predicted permease